MTRLHASDYRSDYPRERRPWVARRWFLYTGALDDPARHNIEVHVDRRWRTRLGASLRFDSPHAETPIDASVHVGPASVFVSTSAGRALNRWLRVESGASRELQVEYYTSADQRGLARRLTHAVLQWSLWTDPEHQVLSRYQKERMSRSYVARRGYVHPVGAVVDRVLGKVVYSTEELATREAVAWLPEGGYPLTLTLERATWKRPRSPWSMTRTTVDFRVRSTEDHGPGFIPDGGDSFGSADGLVASGTRDLTEAEAADPELWAPIAVARCQELVLRDRTKERGTAGWRPDPVPAGVLDPGEAGL